MTDRTDSESAMDRAAKECPMAERVNPVTAVNAVRLDGWMVTLADLRNWLDEAWRQGAPESATMRHDREAQVLLIEWAPSEANPAPPLTPTEQVGTLARVLTDEFGAGYRPELATTTAVQMLRQMEKVLDGVDRSKAAAPDAGPGWTGPRADREVTA